MNTKTSSSSNSVLLLEGVHPFAKKRLEEAGCTVLSETHALSEKELTRKLKDFQILGFRSKTHLTKKILNQNSHLKVAGAFCLGTNAVDIETANQQGIPVFNSPYSNTRSVAELVLGVLIALSRRLCEKTQNLHKGVWEKAYKGSHEVRGKTLGIVGYGHIGSQVSILAESLGLKVCFYDILPKLPIGNSTPLQNLESLLKVSDFVTLHVPATPLTKNMITSKEIKKMKKNSFLVNMSRGSVVHIPALVEHLKNSHLAGAALDVFPQEPSENKGKFFSPLQHLPNVILTPHIGGSTEEAQENIGLEVAEKIIKYLFQGSSMGAVNFPSLEPPPLENCHRILNIHKNVQGVLSNINGIISDLGANIEKQHLATDINIGYLIMDVDKMVSKDIFDRIKNLNTSIKTRILP